MIYAITPHELATLDLLAVSASGLIDQQDAIIDLICHTLRLSGDEKSAEKMITAYVRGGARDSIETFLATMKIVVDEEA